jgi:hypothetical protein
MPRAAITINNLGRYSAATTVVQTSGDPTPDHHSVDGTFSPKLLLRMENTNVGSAVAFTVELTAGGNESYGQAVTLSYSVPASGIEAVLLDVPASMLQSGNLIHLTDSVPDANFGDMRFEAYTWS